MRLRNSAVDSNGSSPARSLARIERKNHGQEQRRRATIRPSISQTLLSAARMPDDEEDQADRRQDRAARVEVAGRIGGQRIVDLCG